MVDIETLFKLSYGMCILSSSRNGKLNACIVNTVFQVTPEPPIMAMSVNKSCLTWEYINETKKFAVSILTEEAPMPFMGKFGFRTGRDIDKFEGVKYRLGENGCPIILDYTTAYLEGEVLQAIDVATHTLYVAKITACEATDASKEPMTYSYYRVVKQGRTPKSAATYVDKDKIKS